MNGKIDEELLLEQHILQLPWADLIDSLVNDGVAVADECFPRRFTQAVQSEIRESEARFQAAKIGKGDRRVQSEAIRSDRTNWWDFHALTPLQSELFVLFDRLKSECNRELFLGLNELEGHYAVYEPGAFYKVHLDRFKEDSRRTLSVVAFFNLDWKSEDGGALTVTLKSGEKRSIVPEAGRLVFFLSSLIPHEVEVTHRKRFSFAGWWKTAT